MKKRKKGRRFTFSTSQQSSQHRSTEMEPEDLTVYIRRAEKQVLPIIKERQLGPGAAQFLLAQQTQVLVTGDPRLTVESGMAIANRVLELWQEGYYTPEPEYPFTLEETLLEIQTGPKAKGTTRPVSNHSALRTARNHMGSAKWLGESCNIPRQSYGKFG